MADGGFFGTFGRGFGGGLTLGAQLGMQNLQLDLQQEHEQRTEKIADRKAVIDTYAGLSNILNAKVSPAVKKVLTKNYLEQISTMTGKPVDPTVVDVLTKGDETDHSMILKGLGAFLSENQQVGAAHLMDALGDPQEAMKLVQQGTEISNKREDNERQARQAQSMETSRQVTQAEQHRHNLSQEGISGAHLGIARANLGLRQQEVAIAKSTAKSTNPTEVVSGELFNKPYSQLGQDERAQVNQRVRQEGLQRIREQGAMSAQNRPLPAQQTEELADMQSSLDMLKYVEQQFDPKFVGPMRGGVGGWVMEKTGGMSDQEINFRKSASTYENILTKVRSGAAVNAQESIRLQKEVPLPSDRPEQLRGKLRISRKILENALKRRQEALHASGYGQVPSFGGGGRGPVEVMPGVTVEEIE